MAEKEKVYITEGGGGEGMGMLAGILVVVLIGVGLLFASGALRTDDGTIDVNVKVPKIDAPGDGK